MDKALCSIAEAAADLARFEVPDEPLPHRLEGDAVLACPDSEILARELVGLLISEGCTVSTAESLTGGLIAATLTSVPGSSAVVRGGIVSYASEVKRDVLGVDEAVLSTDGPVSYNCACQMADGACRLTHSDIAVAVTGIAGPSGDEPGKPVGTVYIGSAICGALAKARRYCFPGDREEVRAYTVAAALVTLYECVCNRATHTLE